MNDEPTELTVEDIDKLFDELLNLEIKEKTCSSCGKGYYLDSYGYMFWECHECYFKRWPKEEREAFYRSFFE